MQEKVFVSIGAEIGGEKDEINDRRRLCSQRKQPTIVCTSLIRIAAGRKSLRLEGGDDQTVT